jgi:hypothetical protein
MIHLAEFYVNIITDEQTRLRKIITKSQLNLCTHSTIIGQQSIYVLFEKKARGRIFKILVLATVVLKKKRIIKNLHLCSFSVSFNLFYCHILTYFSFALFFPRIGGVFSKKIQKTEMIINIMTQIITTICKIITTRAKNISLEMETLTRTF